MKRRDFITLLGGATAWPLAARARSRVNGCVGVLMPYAANDPQVQTRNAEVGQIADPLDLTE